MKVGAYLTTQLILPVDGGFNNTTNLTTQLILPVDGDFKNATNLPLFENFKAFLQANEAVKIKFCFAKIFQLQMLQDYHITYIS